MSPFAKGFSAFCIIIVIVYLIYNNLSTDCVVGEWSECSNGQKTRTITPATNGGTACTEIDTSQNCTNCVVGQWTACSNGQKTRTITPATNGGTACEETKTIEKCVWQYFNNSYCSNGEYTIRDYLSKSTTTIENILNNVVNNPSYIAVYIYDGHETNTWEVSYVSVSNIITRLYSRYGSMSNFKPNNRYIYIHIDRATNAGVYVKQSYDKLA
jgi:hypothetical protein